MKKIFMLWLPFAILATILSSLVYGAVQQEIRQSANDPQIQMAEDLASQVALGASPTMLNTLPKTDISKSLAPFVIIYDNKGAAVASTAELDGATPALPTGVLDDVRSHGEDRITWQPKPGVRSAIVIVKVFGPNTGFVLAGRSLREVEFREKSLEIEVLAAWVASIVLTFGACWLAGRKL